MLILLLVSSVIWGDVSCINQIKSNAVLLDNTKQKFSGLKCLIYIKYKQSQTVYIHKHKHKQITTILIITNWIKIVIGIKWHCNLKNIFECSKYISVATIIFSIITFICYWGFYNTMNRTETYKFNQQFQEIKICILRVR